MSLPLRATQLSRINAHFVNLGSTIEPTNRIILPASAKDTQTADAVDKCMYPIQRLSIPGDQVVDHSGLGCIGCAVDFCQSNLRMRTANGAQGDGGSDEHAHDPTSVSFSVVTRPCWSA